jgi:hypothetical protein
MTFVPENELEAALMRAATDAAARPEFCHLLVASDLFLIGRTDAVSNGDPHILPAGGHLEIASIVEKGRAYHPIFSSLRRLREYLEQPDNYVRLNGRDLFECTRGAALRLNPGSDYGKTFFPEEIENLLHPERASPVVIHKPTQVLIGQPAIYPHALVDALGQAFARLPEVLSAYLVQVAFPDGPPHPLIGVETSGEWPPVSAEIGRTAAAIVPGMLIDAMPLDRSEPATTLSCALFATQPFYAVQPVKAS